MTVIDYPRIYTAPGETGSPIEVRPRYENFIGGTWVAPLEGQYKENITSPY